jgi:hypothetical protein
MPLPEAVYHVHPGDIREVPAQDLGPRERASYRLVGELALVQGVEAGTDAGAGAAEVAGAAVNSEGPDTAQEEAPAEAMANDS